MIQKYLKENIQTVPSLIWMTKYDKLLCAGKLHLMNLYLDLSYGFDL